MSLRFFRSAVLALSISVLIVPVRAQQSQGGQQGGQTGGTNTGSRGDNRTPPPSPPPPPRRTPPLLFVSGAVITGDGSPLPSGITIERSCNGQVLREANVDSSGHFSFQVGGNRNASVLPDASDDYGSWDPRGMSPRLSPFESENTSSNSLMGCELRARVGGYRSTSVMLEAGTSSLGQIDAGTIVLQPIAKMPGTLVSATNMQAPKPAKKAMERGEKAIQKKDFAEAEKNFKEAVEAYPKFAAAWFSLGRVYEFQKRTEDARDAYNKAVVADSMYVSPYIQLARLAGLEQRWQEVADLTDRALSLDPIDFPDGYFFNAVANFNLKKMDAAERSARKAQRLDTRHLYPQAALILANILELKQDLPGSMEQLREYLKSAPQSALADQARGHLKELEKTVKTSANSESERR